jgi:hypothetical protein
VLGDIDVRPMGVSVRITWQSFALGDAASVELVTPELYERWLVRPWQGPARCMLEIPLQLDMNSIRIAVAPS